MLRTLEILDAKVLVASLSCARAAANSRRATPRPLKDNQLRALPREIGRLSAMLRLHLKVYRIHWSV